MMANGRARRKIIERRELKTKNKVDKSDSDDVYEEEVEEEEEFVCNVDEPEDYGKTVDSLQSHLLKNMRRDGEFLNLVLRSKSGNSKDVKLLLEETSVYLSCVIVDNVKLEFGKHGDPQIFGDSTHLGYGEQYSQMCKPGLTNVQVGHSALLNAFNKLNRFRGVDDKNFTKWCDEIKLSLATLIFMFPECVRFRWISQAVKDWVADGRINACVVDWMADLVPFWSKITDVVLDGGDCDHDPYAPPPPPLPVGRHVYGDREVTCARLYKLWADNCLIVKNLKRKRADD